MPSRKRVQMTESSSVSSNYEHEGFNTCLVVENEIVPEGNTCYIDSKHTVPKDCESTKQIYMLCGQPSQDSAAEFSYSDDACCNYYCTEPLLTPPSTKITYKSDINYYSSSELTGMPELGNYEDESSESEDEDEAWRETFRRKEATMHQSNIRYQFLPERISRCRRQHFIQ